MKRRRAPTPILLAGLAASLCAWAPSRAESKRGAAASSPPTTTAAPTAAASGLAGLSGTAQRARMLMGTLCTAEARGADTAAVVPALNAALDRIAELDSLLSPWRPESELTAFNEDIGQPHSCTRDFFAVLDSAVALARLTRGAFDPTVEPLTRIWDLRGEGRVPSDSAIVDATTRVGWQLLEMEHRSFSSRLEVVGGGLDLGGIGKGFALDRAAEALAERRVATVRLNFGGEVLVRADSGSWTIAIAHPERRLEPVVELRLANGAVSTSGQSERGFTRDGVRYGHVLDPRTGRPVATRASVSVVAASATRADALSTALLVMGRERAAAFAQLHPEIAALWLEPAGDSLRAWKWNLTPAASDPRVRWMN